MKYIFATDEDLGAAGIRQTGNTDRKTFRKENVDWKVCQRGKCKRTGKLWTDGGDNLVRTKK